MPVQKKTRNHRIYSGIIDRRFKLEPAKDEMLKATKDASFREKLENLVFSEHVTLEKLDSC